MEKPFSQSAENNREPILEVLKEIITTDNKRLLEIGAGTGQHAVYFAPEFPHVQWVTSEVSKYHDGIKQWLKEAKQKNVHGPLQFEVGKDSFPKQKFDLVFMANVFHIMEWKKCKTLMKLFGRHLREGSQVVLYGPFNYDGEYTSESNKEFDAWIKEKYPGAGIRSFEDIKSVMEKNGFQLFKDYEMPVNNRTLVFTKLNWKPRQGK